ncbi:PAS domain S-box protein [Lederbergia ruris]|uniref:histidine kinase n=1 Tax=Lederbergia ruris TaxID=217495 RepID=A0ABQ4KMZ2_9BACI|nr:PAS domain S-box protein [Lederbergia ruris]GIN59292.1 hypothetical protein J8TS2_36110 [Lederbergia ruris]
MNNADLFHELEISQAMIYYSDILFSSVTVNGQFTYVSPPFLKFSGYRQEELKDASLIDFLHPNDKNLWEGVDPTHPPEKLHYRLCRKEGDYVWLETTLIPNEGQKGFTCISRNITDQIAIKERLEEQEEKYRQLVENLNDTVGIITKDGDWIYINKSGKKLFGVTRREEIIGRTVFEFLSPESSQALKDLLLKNELNQSLELTVNRCDGQIKYVLIKLIPAIHKGRETFQIQIRDLTDQKKAEEMMDRTEKLSVVGQLAASIAHEIRNPLTVIKGFIQLLNQMKNIQYLEVVLGELKRIEEIINDLLVLAKPQSSKMEKLNLKELLESTIAFFQSEALLHDIDIQTNIDLADPNITGEANRLKQVFINILKNASEAMPDGGRIDLSAQKLQDGRIVIKIEDNGPGIPEERMQNLGQPFYSTKEKGTGLGLMICYRIIKNHGGDMEIKSKVNEGTTVHIFLPEKGTLPSESDEKGS